MVNKKMRVVVHILTLFILNAVTQAQSDGNERAVCATKNENESSLDRNVIVAQDCTYNGETFSDPLDCSSYYMCIYDGNEYILVHYTCPIDSGFNANTATCQTCGTFQCFGTKVAQVQSNAKATCLVKNEKLKYYVNRNIIIEQNCTYADQTFADPTDCAAYYRCIDNGSGGYVLVHYACPFDSGYDASIGGCAPCGTFQCFDDSGETHTTPKTTATTDWNDPASQCNTVGQYVPDPANCTDYYVCNSASGGGFTVVHVPCPPGYAFDSVTLQCVTPAGSAICTGPTGPTGPTTPNPTGIPTTCDYPSQYLPDPDDCTKYYICDGNLQRNPKDCYDTEFYDPNYAQCNINTEVDCNASNGNRPLPIPDVKPTGVKPVDPFPPCLQYGQLIPDQYYCEYFWKCNEFLVPDQYRCSTKTNFDKSRLTCTYPQYAIC